MRLSQRFMSEIKRKLQLGLQLLLKSSQMFQEWKTNGLNSQLYLAFVSMTLRTVTMTTVAPHSYPPQPPSCYPAVICCRWQALPYTSVGYYLCKHDNTHIYEFIVCCTVAQLWCVIVRFYYTNRMFWKYTCLKADHLCSLHDKLHCCKHEMPPKRSQESMFSMQW